MLTRRHLLSAAAASGVLATAAACSPSSSGGSGDGGSDGGESGKTLTFRLWDENAKPAYEKSLKEFTKQSGWDVKVDLVAWNDYWTKLPLDVASGDAADVYWMNSANYVQFQEAGNLMAIEGDAAKEQGKWEKAVVDLYTRDGKLWGVPQIWDSIALFYNKKLVEDADIDPTELSFDPSADSDPLREAGKALTVDKDGKHPGDDGFAKDSRKVYGFNSQADRQAIIGPFLASNGADWSDDKDQLAFASDEGIAVFQYLADLVNKDLIAPSAGDTNENGDLTKELFGQGKLALFQSGPYSLQGVSEGVGDSFEWALAPMVKGPDGAKSLVHGVVAVGNAKADDDKKDGITQLLAWLGSADGQRPLAEEGVVSFPGHKDVQDAFIDYWKDKGQDVSVFVEAAKDPAPADEGAKANAGLEAAMPVFQEIFIGRKSAKDGLPEAQKAGNDAMK
jgi:multiple sugar transport system substrate-binding protein